MGCGVRHDALNDQCNDSNYCKLRDLHMSTTILQLDGQHAYYSQIYLLAT
jgi:hypothetical protein